MTANLDVGFWSFTAVLPAPASIYVVGDRAVGGRGARRLGRHHGDGRRGGLALAFPFVAGPIAALILGSLDVLLEHPEDNRPFLHGEHGR